MNFRLWRSTRSPTSDIVFLHINAGAPFGRFFDGPVRGHRLEYPLDIRSGLVPGPPESFGNVGLGAGPSPSPQGGGYIGGRGNFFSRTATATDSPMTSICGASMPHIPKWFARAVAPTVSEIGAPKVFRPVRYIAEGKKIRRGDPNFFDWNVCRSHWGTSSRNSVNKISKIGELGGIL
jgi:hypothetical protein